MKCPCCSGLNYEACCKLYHDGMPAPTPLALMRSRYSAYALKNADYIMRTTHPRNPNYERNRKKWSESILEFCNGTQFVKLEILETGPDTVKFAAHLKYPDRDFILEELSRFQKVDGQWYYLKAETSNRNS
ncbi:MAG TPA: YchJ family metal-binding protein [Chlamydiales bacterium]|nr:YchJ family metal-binding protein [Chlamydiales bacterium]